MASLWKSSLSVRCMSPTRVGGSSVCVRQHANSPMLQTALGQHSSLRTFSTKGELNSDAKPLDSSAVRSANSPNSRRSTSQPQGEHPQSLKASVLNQYAKLKNMSPDITSFAKTVALIHSGLPHYLPSYQKLLPQSMRIRVFPATSQLQGNVVKKESETLNQAVAQPVEETESQSTQVYNKNETMQKTQRKPGAPLQVSNHSKAINRETTDFTTAMHETNTSVQTYYNTVAGESATTPFSEEIPDTRSTTDTTESSKTKVKPSPPVEDATGWKISSYLPGRASQQKAFTEEAKRPVKKRELIAIRSIERRTRELVVSLRSATTNASKLMRLEEFSNHISKYPNSRNQAMRSKVMPCLMRLSRHGDKATQQQAMVALSLLGYTNPPKGRGVRILSLDGGGTRGLVAIELMKHMERVCQRPIHELFDYICGVSTGSLISIMIGAFRVPLDEVDEIYREFSKEMFERSRLMGASKLFTSHAYYDTQLWEAILKQNFSETSFIDCMKDPLCPKLASVSALTNFEKIQCHVFRNYNLPPSVQSHYLGSCSFKLWEAIRASSAAPGYYEEFKLGNMVHQDGGVLTNNPAAIAIHECRLLWPQETLQCVVSLGTGRYEPTSMPQTPAYTSLKTKVVKIVQSATDTEAVHTVLHDLLQPSTYFRFNPYLSEDFNLDEVRADKWEQMLSDTQMYCRKNAAKLDDVATQLHQPRHIYQKISDNAIKKCSLLG